MAGRSVGTNLGVASMTCTGLGIVTVMYTAEMGFRYGFAGAVPGIIYFLAYLLIGGTGLLIGPMRKARVITIPELLERRFGKRVRWLAGLVTVLGGLLNMGIFLRLGGEFLVHAAGLDPEYLKATMIVLLAIALVYTVVGGMVSVIVTNFFQFIVIGIAILTTTVLVLRSTPWNDLTRGLNVAYRSGVEYCESERLQQEADRARFDTVAKSKGPEAAAVVAKELQQQRAETLRHDAGQLASRYVLVDTSGDAPRALTMGNPVDPTAQEGVGLLWVVWQALFLFSAAVTWQTGVTRALSAEDVATSKRMYRRNAMSPASAFLLFGLWAAAAYLFFCKDGGLPEGVGTLTAMPEYLARLLPAGVLGLVIAGMLAAEMSTDSSYMLTWATVIYNDLIMPCLHRPLSEKARLLVVRTVVVLIGIFLVFYGLLYELPGTAWDYLVVTGTIYVASVFTLLMGAIYMPWTNRLGAYAAIVLGAIGPLSFVIVNAVVEPSQRIAPATAGLSAYGMAFGGMFFGSLLGNWLAGGNANVTASTEGETDG